MIKKAWQAAEWAAELASLEDEFRATEPLLKAIGDEMRQKLILIMIRHSDGTGRGVRVGEIAAELNLSRPAVSHHLKILKDSGLVSIRRDGTKNYYQFSSRSHAFGTLIQMLQHAQDLVRNAAPETDQD